MPVCPDFLSHNRDYQTSYLIAPKDHSWVNRSHVESLREHATTFWSASSSLHALPVAHERFFAAQKLRQRTKQEIKETGKTRFDKALRRRERREGDAACVYEREKTSANRRKNASANRRQGESAKGGLNVVTVALTIDEITRDILVK